MPVVTAFYAALLTPILIWLSSRIIVVRRGRRIAFGDAGDKVLIARIRAHANFTEYVPMAVLLMLLAELLGCHGLLLHVSGFTLIVARLAHARGLTAQPHNVTLRTIGVSATFAVLAALAIANLWLSLPLILATLPL